MKTQKNKKALSLKEGYIQYAYRHACINDDKHVENMAIVKGFWNTQKLTSSRTTYRIHGNLPVKDFIMQSFKNEPYQFMTAYPYYDSFGHALFEINRGGTRTIRLWGYNCRYLVAEMYNIPETDMNAAWNIIRPENFSFSSSPVFSFVNVLRRSYPDIQVYLYTYSPLVGVCSVTSPNGKVTNFRYDAAGRLVERTDHAGHVESRYEYNYMPY